MANLKYINTLGYSTIADSWGYATNKELAKLDLMTALNITCGECDWDPNLGTTIRNKMFDKMTTANENEIISEIKRVFNDDPRFTLVSLISTEIEKGWIFNTVVQYLDGTPEEWVFSVDRQGKASVGNYPVKD